jgi:copper resistance protein C
MRPSGLALIATLVLPAPLFGHAVLTKASLDTASVRANTATKVVLVDARNEEHVLEVLPQGEPGKVSVTVPPLAPGTYGLRYKVLAADGHVTESVLRFTVAAAD